MWALIKNKQIVATYDKLPKNNGEGGVNLHSIKKYGKLLDENKKVIIEKHDFGIDYDGLKKLGYYKITETKQPSYNTEKENQPIATYQIINNEIVQVWEVTPKTKEQLQQELNNKWQNIREIRNQLLSQSDWTQLADVPASPKWIEYRKTLRDITELFDSPDAVIWPEKPQ